MSKRKIILFKIITILTVLIVIISSCKIVDLSQDTILAIQESEKIASQKLEEVVQKQGFNKMESAGLYRLKTTDEWKGILGRLTKLWPEQTTKFSFKFNFNTFDGNALFLSGKNSGDLIGVQTGRFYEKSKGDTLIKSSNKADKVNSMEFGITGLHYILELPYRLQNAPIKRYYGKKKHNGITYDLVFASWGSEKANKKYDQFVLWINTESKLVDYCVYTVRESLIPMTSHKYASVAYLNYKNQNGFLYPSKIPAFVDDQVFKKSNLEDYLHQFSIHEFSFGDFKEDELYPIEGLEKKIDTK